MSLQSYIKCVTKINNIVRKQHVVFCKLKFYQTRQFRDIFTPTSFCSRENEPNVRVFQNRGHLSVRGYSQQKVTKVSSKVTEKETLSESDTSKEIETESSDTADSDTATITAVYHNGYNRNNGYNHSRTQTSDTKEVDNPTFQGQDKAGELLRSSRRGGVSVTRRLGMLLPDDFWKSPEEAKKYLHPSDIEGDPREISTNPDTSKHQWSHSVPLQSLNPVDRLNSLLHNETVVSEVHNEFETMTMENSERICDDEVKKGEYPQLPLQVGELAMLNFYARRRVFQKLVSLVEGNVYESKKHGSVAHNDILGLHEDSKLESTAGYTVQVKRPTLEDYSVIMRKIVVTPDVKVLSSALSHVGVSPGDAILEAGTGQGVSALVFSQAVGVNGLVHSVEKIEENHVKAQKSFHRWADSYDKSHVTNPWPRNVTFHHSSLVHFQSQIQYDMVFLDLPSPVSSIDTVISHVKAGKCILMYTPSPTRIVSFLKEAGMRRLPLVLEGVWEEGRKLWHVRTEGFSHDHLVPLNLTEERTLDYPTVNEKETAFIAKFRKIIPLEERGNVSRHFTGVLEKESLGRALSKWWRSMTKQTESGSRDNVRPLQENDFVAIRGILQPKNRDRVQVVGRLKPGGVYTNDWGAISHTSLIGQPDGKILRMMSGFLIYPFRMTLEEYLSLSWSFRFLTVRNISLLQRLEDVRVGDNLLVVGDPPTVAPVALLLSRAVWHSGQVEVVNWNRNQWVADPVQKVAEWKAIYLAQTDQSWPDNIHIHSECDSVPTNVRTAVFDGVTVCVTSRNATFCLDEIVALVKPMRYLTVLVETVTQVNKLLEFAHSHSTQLHLVDVTEDKERRWHVRPVDEWGGSFEPDYDEAFICRPKPRKFAKIRNTMFLVRLRKI